MAEPAAPADSELKQLRALAARNALLSEVVLLIARSPDFEPLLNDAVNKFKWALDFECCTFALTHGDAGTYSLRSLLETRRDVDKIEIGEVPMSEGLSGQVIRSGRLGLVTGGEIGDASLATVLALPLAAFGKVLGALTFGTVRENGFSDDDIKIARSFATHLALALDRWNQTRELQQANENLQLEKERAEQALRDLEQAQASLVHAEKMASLGQLTAGIAHEIKNPLNFVNNFAQTSIELLDELREVVGPGLDSLDQDSRDEADDLLNTLKSDLDTIFNHGRRADGIVKNMLLHSRGGEANSEPTDINALVEESLNLAYHGERARDSGFNIDIEHDFDPEAGQADLLPQEITRVLVNLFGNGFYATRKRKEAESKGYEPSIKVATRNRGEAVEILVRDNGIGMSEAVREKLFTPFFTTKPAGEGTGLGLSLSYDIITQQHKGAISVDSEVGSFTEFTIRLPRQFGGKLNTSKGRTA